jgi:hypothetical protein
VGWDTRGENHEAMLQRRQPVNLSQASFWVFSKFNKSQKSFF